MLDFAFEKLIAAKKNPGDVIDTIKEIAPFIIFAIIWLFAVIAKVVKGTQKDQQGGVKPEARKSQPDFDDLLKAIGRRYAAAKEQVRKAAEEQAARLQPPVLKPQPGPAPAPYAPQPQAPAPIRPAPPAIPQRLAVGGTPTVKEPAYEQLQPATAAPAEEEHIILAHHPYWDELTKEFTHPDSLRKLILYTEILGTPVGLRD